ncbi:MAG: hypothetical protein SFU25_12025 [Candidatus Caenarcaniphilales bacterium]|nr:hypothetical protein [Candidatus Caenarcaniphilales bacterium]
MRNKQSKIFLGFTLTAVAAFTFFIELNAEARSGTFTNSRGGSGNHSVNWNGNQRTANGSYINSKGRIFNSNSNGNYDRSTKIYTGNTSVTGPQGNTKNYGVQRQNLGNGAASTTVTGPSGISRSYSSQYSHDREANTINRQVTGPNGKTREQTTQYSKNPDGSYSYTTNGSNGYSNSGNYVPNR